MITKQSATSPERRFLGLLASSPVNRARFGLSVKLQAAFGLVAGLTVVAAAVAFL
jgi:hypothetical protein